MEGILPAMTSIGGGFFLGAIIGYFAKKIIKILMFVAGGIVGLILYLQQQQIISINIDKLQDSSTFILSTTAFSFDKMTQIGDTTSLGIPIIASLSAGFTLGFVKS